MFVIFIIIFCFIFSPNAGALDKYYEKSIYTAEYGLRIYPDYPPKVGDTITLSLRTFEPAQKVTLYSDREKEIPMTFKQGHWWGTFTIPDDYQEGSHFFIVSIRYPPTQPPVNKLIYNRVRRYLFVGKYPASSNWSTSQVWYKTSKGQNPDIIQSISNETTGFVEKEEPLPIISGEAVSFDELGPEANNLIIKGSQMVTFKSRSLIGSKEGYVPGTTQTREENLRLNISGQAAGLEIDANLFRSSGFGISQISDREEKISILMRRGTFEAYLGDFNAGFTDTEFCALDKMLSGARLKGGLGVLGFNLFYSSPKGEAEFVRMYGDNSQGPFSLGSAPVVIDSERVYVDGMLQKRGDDYNIDYQAGTITFIKKVIDIKSIINVYYDFRQTVYQHATYGLRATLAPWPFLNLGATYINDSDSLADAINIRQSMSQEAVNPASHYVVGADAGLDTENLDINTEVAYSLKNLDLLNPGSEEAGRAGKAAVSFGLGPLDISAKVKRVGTQYCAISDANPKQDVWEYAGVIGFRPFSGFGANASYDYNRYLQQGVYYENAYKNARTAITPDRLPSLQYSYMQNSESNDPVTGDLIQRIITRDALESTYQLGFLAATAKGTFEKWLRRSPSEEVTDYKKANVGIATIGLEKISLSSNVELEERKEPDGSLPVKKSYNLNLSFSPVRAFMLSSNLQVIEDTSLGNSSVIDSAVKFEPISQIKTEAKYSINTLLDSFPATSETVSKQTGSLMFDVRPFSYLRLRYLYRPAFTRIVRTGTLSYNNDQRQAEINILPIPEMMLGWLSKTGSSFNVNNQDYPDYTLKNNTLDTNSTLYTLKLAPMRILSIELNISNDNSNSLTLVSTQEPYSYSKGQSANNSINLVAKTSLSEKFSYDTSYTYQKSDQGSGEAGSSLVNTKSHALSLKGIWNLSDIWTFSVSGAYMRSSDYLLGTVTYTLSPGLGFIYRYQDRLRIDFDGSYSRSYSGQDNEKINLSLRSKYTVSTFVDILLRIDQEIGYVPNYRLTDITGNVQINL